MSKSAAAKAAAQIAAQEERAAKAEKEEAARDAAAQETIDATHDVVDKCSAIPISHIEFTGKEPRHIGAYAMTSISSSDRGVKDMRLIVELQSVLVAATIGGAVKVIGIPLTAISQFEIATPDKP